MSEGPRTRCLRLPMVRFLAVGLVLVLVLAGCGKSDQEEAVSQGKSGAMLPGGAADSVLTDPVTVPGTETGQVAGTLPDAEGVSEDPAPAEGAHPGAAAELKAAPGKAEVPPAPSGSRPATTISTSDASFSLQLGSFTNLANARKQVERLSALGYTPVIEESDLGGQVYHRVMLRGVGDMAEASRLGEYIHSELGIAYLVRRGE